MLDEKDLGPEAFGGSSPEHEVGSEVVAIDAPAAAGEVAMNGSVELPATEAEHGQTQANGQLNGDTDNIPADEEPKGIVFGRIQEKWLGGIFSDEQIDRIKNLPAEGQDVIVDGLLLHYSTLVTHQRPAEVIARNSEFVRLFLRGQNYTQIADKAGITKGNVGGIFRFIPGYISESLAASSLERLITNAGKNTVSQQDPAKDDQASFEASYYNYYGVKPPKREEKTETRRTGIKTLTFRFSVGGRMVSANFDRGRGFERMTLQQKIALGIGHSSTCIQTPEQQKDQIRKIAAKADKDEESFDKRFKKGLKAEVAAKRAAVNGDGLLHLTDKAVDEVLDGQKEIKISNLAGTS